MRSWCGLLLAVLAVAAAGCGGNAGREPISPAPARLTPPFVRLLPAPRPRVHRGPSPAATLARLARRGAPVFCAGRHGRRVALTFDDGPGPFTALVLRELRRARLRATFFLIGKRARLMPGEVRRERARGVLGDHTMTHAYLPGLPPAAAAREIDTGRAAVARAGGAPVRLLRPPYGARTPAVDRLARRRGMVEILWDVDSGDSDAARPEGFRQIAATVMREIHPGSIVLMHENHGQTIRALPVILRALRRRHLHPVTVPELLTAQPTARPGPSVGPHGCTVHG